MFHYRVVQTAFDEPVEAIEVTHERSDGSFVIGYLAHAGAHYVAYTLDYRLVCSTDDELPCFFLERDDAAQALTDTSGYHLMPRYP